MISRITLTATLAVLAAAPVFEASASSSALTAQDAMDDRQIQSALSRAERRVESVRGALEDYQAAADFAKDRQAERFNRAMERARDALEPLEGTGHAGDLIAELDALQDAFEGSASVAQEAAGDEEDARARLDQWRASGELDRDIETLEGMQALLTDARRFDVNSGLFGRFGDPATLEQFVADVGTWDETLAAFEALAGKYESLGDRVYFRSGGAYAAIRDIRNRLPETEAAMARFKSEAPGAVEAALNEAAALAQSAVDEQRFGVFTGLNSPMRMALIAPQAMVEVYAAMPNTTDGEAAALRRTLADGLERIDRLKADASEAIISQNTLPPNGYAGAEAEAIRNAARAGFEEVHGRQDIIEIRIPDGNWTRHQGWRWSRVDRAYQRYDYSTIDAFVVERTNGRIATFWRVTVHKKHMEGDALIADPASRNRHAPNPEQQLLISNL